ncbi:unnamed protein product, partial [Ceratitis capitata]
TIYKWLCFCNLNFIVANFARMFLHRFSLPLTENRQNTPALQADDKSTKSFERQVLTRSMSQGGAEKAAS